MTIWTLLDRLNDTLDMVLDAPTTERRWTPFLTALTTLDEFDVAAHVQLSPAGELTVDDVVGGSLSDALLDNPYLSNMLAHAATTKQPLSWPQDMRASHTLFIPIVGHKAHHGWLMLTSARGGVFADPEMATVSRHIGSLLGLLAGQLFSDAPRPDNSLERIRALYRAVLLDNDVMLRPGTETNMIQRTCERLMSSGLFTAVGICPRDPVIEPVWAVEAGVPQPIADDPDTWRAFAHDLGWHSYAHAAIIRCEAAWGTLELYARPADVFDTDTRELIQWAAELLGHGLDELDLKHKLHEEEARQRYMATHDLLTDLWNRSAFLEHLPEAMQRAEASGTLLAVGLMDLDNFKPINDTYGHEVGDRVLKAVAHRVAAFFGEDQCVARLGGDEFVFALEGLSHVDSLHSVLAAFEDQMAEPYDILLPGNLRTELTVRASVGLTLYPLDREAPEILIGHADRALYLSKDEKDQRGQCWRLYQFPKGTAHLFRQYLPEGIRVHYQPIVDVQTGHVHSLEALVRLWDGEHLLSPARFIPQLSIEELQIVTFGVLEHVLTDMRTLDAAWNDQSPLSISVNLEPSMLSPECIQHIGQQVAEAAIAPDRITLELLETSDFLSQKVAKHQLQVLKEKRFQLALDDVGSAYSSLLRIRELPIDTLKLDQAFVRSIPQNPDDLLFVIAMQVLARGFHANFVAEGVENEAILDALQVLGVNRIQGYVFTRPLPLDALIQWGREYRPIPSDGQPHTLLGAFAAHLAYQSLGGTAGEPRLRAVICPLTRYLEDVGHGMTPLARRHLAYHEQWRPDNRLEDESVQLKMLVVDQLSRQSLHDVPLMSAHGSH